MRIIIQGIRLLRSACQWGVTLAFAFDCGLVVRVESSSVWSECMRRCHRTHTPASPQTSPILILSRTQIMACSWPRTSSTRSHFSTGSAQHCKVCAWSLCVCVWCECVYVYVSARVGVWAGGWVGVDVLLCVGTPVYAWMCETTPVTCPDEDEDEDEHAHLRATSQCAHRQHYGSGQDWRLSLLWPRHQPVL